MPRKREPGSLLKALLWKKRIALSNNFHASTAQGSWAARSDRIAAYPQIDELQPRPISTCIASRDCPSCGILVHAAQTSNVEELDCTRSQGVVV